MEESKEMEASKFQIKNLQLFFEKDAFTVGYSVNL